MTKQQKPKRKGRPAKFGPRRNFNFRLSEHFHKRLTESAAQRGLSLSEELERRVTRDMAWEDDIETMKKKASAALDAANLMALRAAGLIILWEAEGRPNRVVVDLETLLAEADGLARGPFGVGFIDPKAAPSPTRPMTEEEKQRALEKLEELKRMLLQAAVVNKVA